MKKIIDIFRRWLIFHKNVGYQLKDESPSEYETLKIQPTPNPQAFQFILNKPILNYGSIHYNSAEEAQNDPFSNAVFEIFGVETIFLKENFITVTKSPVVSWNIVIPQIEKAIVMFLKFYETQRKKSEIFSPKVKEGPSEFTPDEFLQFPEDQKKRIIETIFDYGIRPALARDGGDVALIAVQGTTIQVHFQGACGKCPSSTRGTLQFIENMIKENLHSELKLEAI